MTTTQPRGKTNAPAPAPPDSLPTEYPDAVRMALVALAAVGVGFFLCHLPYGRIATLLLCLAGAALAGLSILGLERRAWIGWLGVAFNAIFVILLVGFPSQLSLTGWLPARQQETPGQPQGISADGWVDAGEAAWKDEGGVQVALAFAMVGSDPANSGARGESSFWIGVTVTNTSTQSVKFEGWDAVTPGGPALATKDGIAIPGRRAGQFVAVTLAPGQSAECLLAFDVPPPGQAVRLELPPAAYGGKAPARFQIAPELIVRK